MPVGRNRRRQPDDPTPLADDEEGPFGGFVDRKLSETVIRTAEHYGVDAETGRRLVKDVAFLTHVAANAIRKLTGQG